MKLRYSHFADETAKTSHDVVKLAGAVDGVVVKTLKSEGIHEALHMICKS
ncbi:MAG TPA: hypothetical protein VLE49_01185 [Anaerolineales bacterium]|nr:hypothetical protein [Anaerolineales bacterium]